MARTVAEIGRIVGCSSATVSRAMNNSGSVSPETRAAVMKALRETQYLSKRGGSRRRGMESRSASDDLVEVVLYRRTPIERLSYEGGHLAVGPRSTVPDEKLLSHQYQLANSFYRTIIDGAVEELGRWQHKAVLQSTAGLVDSAFMTELNGPDRSGILLLGESGPDLSAFVAQCRHPVVLVDLLHDGWPDVVTSDNLAGISAAFDHVYGLGHRRIGFVGKLDSNFAFTERYVAFKMKMAEAGLPVRPEWVYEGPNHTDVTSEGVAAILRRADRPTAFVCANDTSALGVIRAASNVGVRVPQELSIIGFDDTESAALVTPALTTMRVPMAEMGRQAVRQLMIQIQSGQMSKARGCRVRLVPELVVRQSTAAPAGA